MSDPTLFDIDYKIKMVLIRTTLMIKISENPGIQPNYTYENMNF